MRSRVCLLFLPLVAGCGGPTPDRPADTDDTPTDDTGITTHDSGGSDDTAVDTGAPVGAGLDGGWSIEHDGEVAGATFIHPVNTDKDGAIVAARVASALGGLGIPATSDARRATLNPTRMSDATYVDDVASFIVDDLYGRLAHGGDASQGRLGTDTLVLTSVHRYGLYVAEALHAPVLPLQFISFADDWDQVSAAAERATIIAGWDYDYDGLWLWNKLAAGAPGTPAAALPVAYQRALAAADRVVIVQPDDNWSYCTDTSCADAIEQEYIGSPNPVFLHTSVTQGQGGAAVRALYDAVLDADQVRPAEAADVENLKQWEWGVPDSTITNLRAAWAALGKDPATFTVIRGGVVDMYAWTPALWAAYLEKNGVSPRGVAIQSYWAAYPALDRAAALLPFPSYSWWQPDWHPLDDNARAILGDLCPDGPCAAGFAANSYAFVNAVGSARDPEGVQALFTDFGLTADAGTWYGYGFNAEGSDAWTGWAGEPVASGWEIAAVNLQDPARAPYADHAWAPLTVDEVCGLGRYTCE